MRAVDRWVRAAFSGIFRALSFFRFDGDSQPSHLPLTHTVSPPHEDSGNFTPQNKGGPYGSHSWFVGRNGTDRVS